MIRLNANFLGVAVQSARGRSNLARDVVLVAYGYEAVSEVVPECRTSG